MLPREVFQCCRPLEGSMVALGAWALHREVFLSPALFSAVMY